MSNQEISCVYHQIGNKISYIKKGKVFKCSKCKNWILIKQEIIKWENIKEEVKQAHFDTQKMIKKFKGKFDNE